MKPLPDISLENIYGPEGNRNSACQDISNLLRGIEKIDDPVELYKIFMAVVQLYFDGLINNGEVSNRSRKETDAWNGSAYKDTLEQLYATGIKATGRLYRGEGVDIEDIRGCVLSSTKQLKKAIPSKEKAAHPHHPYPFYYTQNLGKTISSVEELARVDLIVPVASGGFQVAFLAADILEVDNILGIRYSWNKKKDRETKLPTSDPTYGRVIADKNVLITEDVLIKGESLRGVAKYVERHGARELYGAVTFAYRTTIAHKIFNEKPFIFRGFTE